MNLDKLKNNNWYQVSIGLVLILVSIFIKSPVFLILGSMVFLVGFFNIILKMFKIKIPEYPVAKSNLILRVSAAIIIVITLIIIMAFIVF